MGKGFERRLHLKQIQMTIERMKHAQHPQSLGKCKLKSQ